MGGPLRSPWVFLRGMRETVSAGLTNSLRKKRWEKNEGQKLGGVTDVFFSRVHATLQPALSVRLLFQRLQAVLGLLLLPNCLVGQATTRVAVYTALLN